MHAKFHATTFSAAEKSTTIHTKKQTNKIKQLECGPMPNVMAALPNIGDALCSTPQSLADAHCWSTVQ